MSVAVLVATHDRPTTLRRSLSSLIRTARQAGLALSSIVVADDSQNTSGASATARVVAEISGSFGANATHLPPHRGALGPGLTRNRGLDFLNTESQHSKILMVDDDISFEDTVYQNTAYHSDGYELMRALERRKDLHQRTVVGCGYKGRQDLSTLEHLHLLLERSSDAPVLAASCIRSEIVLESPAGISGAFLYIPERSDKLPRFFSWYNEDYFWLRELQLRGWTLEKSPHEVVHAPPDGIVATTASFKSEQYGEMLWCAARELRQHSSDSQLIASARESLKNRISEMDEVIDIASRVTLEVTTKKMINSLKLVKRWFELLHEELDASSRVIEDLRAIVERCSCA